MSQIPTLTVYLRIVVEFAFAFAVASIMVLAVVVLTGIPMPLMATVQITLVCTLVVFAVMCTLDDVATMQSSADTFLAKGLLTLEHPALCWAVITLGGHFIVGSENKSSEHILPVVHFVKLHLDLANLVFN
ncbi:hypothetical protein B0H14DRAFT_3532240 [Mycena olivaceomarginata]|nr:hypothetical protein B0H14DRAFT_3532240 [Mycena olivaceomarginata]